MPGLDPSTIVFAIIAIFVVWKLRSVLGTRNGAERPPIEPGSGPNLGPNGANAPKPMGQVVRLPTAARDTSTPFGAAPADAAARWKGFAEPGSKVAAGLDAIAAADRSFSPDSFLAGARSAYEMIVTAFAKGDRATLGNLLAPEVLDNFAKAIEARAARAETMETTLVSIDSATFEDARLSGASAQISVRFATKLISHTRDKTGAVTEGSAESVVDHLDIWTFSRDTGSRNPNWQLSATETVH
ncbi:Tim44/TimA family putative adaptor protein [Methylocapsa sp. S129]|uniref:Tim44/TimA family putative adaptor protein n=1 Tax=Methylocapsa sp. S129 TaxID=1641869 RepID=UPI003529F5DA